MRNFMAMAVVVAWLGASPSGWGQEGAKGGHAPLRVGIAGLVHGHVEGFFSHALDRPEIQIVGIAEPDRESAVRYADKFNIDKKLLFTDLEHMLNETHPQAVWAYTNTYDHRKVVETCARHRVPVVMEKPLAVSIGDARAIERAARQAKIQVLVNYVTSWDASNHAAYDLVHENAIGEIRKVVSHNGHSGPKEIGVGPAFLSWLGDPKLNGGGALFDFGCYGADLMTWLMNGRRPDTVTAVTQQIKPEVYPRVDDEGTIILTYRKAQAILQASWNWPFGRKDLEIYGQTGYVITAGSDNIRVRRKGGQEEQTAAKPLASPHDDPIKYFRATILGESEPDGLSSLETNVIVTEILDAARQSASAGRTIRLPLP